MMLFKKHPDQNQPNKNILTVPQEFVRDLFWGGCGSGGVGRAGGLIVLGKMGRDLGGLDHGSPAMLMEVPRTVSLVSPKTGKLRQLRPLRVRTGPQ